MNDTLRGIWRIITDPDWRPSWPMDPYNVRSLRRVLIAAVAGFLLIAASYVLAFAALWDGNDGRLYDAAHILTLGALACGVFIAVSAVMIQRHKRRS